MRRLTRLLCTLCSALSRVLFLAVCVLWVLALAPDEMSEANLLGLYRLGEERRKEVLARIAELPKLKTLRFDACDLTRVDENTPVSATTTTILIADCKVSQGTVRWFANARPGGDGDSVWWLRSIAAGLGTGRIQVYEVRLLGAD